MTMESTYSPLIYIKHTIQYSSNFSTMPSKDIILFQDSPPSSNENPSSILFSGGLFLDNNSLSSSLTNSILSKPSNDLHNSHSFVSLQRKKKHQFKENGFLCVSFSVKRKSGIEGNSSECGMQNGDNGSEETVVGPNINGDNKLTVRVRGRGGGAMNTSKHLWAGAIAAMVSRTCVAPLERLKLEYIVRGEQRKLLDLIKSIASTQGIKGFWKGNLVNVLRTAPFKAVNFYAFDTYRKQIRKLSKNKEPENYERFIAGAAAGITATILCLPLDTIRIKLVASGGEALGGVIGGFQHVIQTEGFFALYKGLLPSILSMAPSGAVFYGVYDILKSAYLRSPEGKKRIETLKKHGEEMNAFKQLELGTLRTLLHGAISGACAEAVTYPFEVVRRQLQLQSRGTRLSTLSTCLKIVEKGGVQALYAGLYPSLLQVLPSAAISYFVYEFMKVVLKVE